MSHSPDVKARRSESRGPEGSGGHSQAGEEAERHDVKMVSR